jgi:putative heme-binding domain-containing protein
MPPNRVSVREADDIVAYLRSMPALAGSHTSGDAGRGAALFKGKGRCQTCHMIKNEGSEVGPDLSGIGGLRRPSELQLSILDPNAEVLPEYQSFRGVTRQGVVITGRRLNEDTFTVQLLDSQGRLASILKSDLRDYAFFNNSIMPSYKDKLTPQEVDDIVTYLFSLKGFQVE